METLGTINSNSHSNRKKSYSSSIAIAIEGRLTPEQEDQILNHYSQLVDDSYRGWFVEKLRAKGKAEFIRIAEHSIKYGKNPQRMFSYLLK